MCRLTAQPHQQIGDRNRDRADLATGAAQARRVRQVARGVEAVDLRRQDFADRTRINGVVGVSADAGVDRAVVHAGAAADAGEGLAQLRIAEDARAAVVEQHKVHLARPVLLAFADGGPR